MWILYAFGSAFFAGITSILAKIGIKNVNSNLATALRTIVVLIFSWIMVFVAGAQTGIGAITLKSLLFLILSGIATGLSWICYFKALQMGDVNKVVPIDKTSNVLTIILAFFILGEKLSFTKVLGMIAIAIGTFMMIEKKNTSENSEKVSNAYIIYALLSAVFASLTSILAKIGIENVESNLATAIRTIFVLIMAWAIVFFQKKETEIKDISIKSWFFILVSGIATGLSWLCYYRALSEGQASIVAPIDKLSILISVGFAYIVFKEKLSKKSAIGLCILTAGTLILLVKF